MGSDIGSGEINPGARTRPKWIAFAVALAAIAALAGVLYVLFAGASKPQADLQAYARGAMAKLEVRADPPAQPIAAFQNAGGEEVLLTSYRGQVLVLNLWATWCAPCREEMPTLAALSQRYKDRGLAVAAISIDQPESLDEAKRLLAELSGGALPFLHDPTRNVVFDLQAPGLPTTILYDRAGHEIARLPGGADWNAPETAALIEVALARPS